MMKDLVKAMRPQQWYKNVIVFAGLVFSLNLFNASVLLKTALAFLIFCMISGTVYIFNDIHDIESDRKHPRKKGRPIASGRLGVRAAGAFGTAVLAAALLLSFFAINTLFFVVALSYFVLIDLYTYWLKNIAVVDIMAISVGFVLRAAAGVAVIMIALSPWLILCTLLLAMFLALCKRKHEMALLGGGAPKHRKSLSFYSTGMIDSFIAVTASMIIMSYSLYTFLATSVWMMLTIPFVIFAIFRYMQLHSLRGIGGETEAMFRDRAMLADMAVWILMILLVLYGVPELLVGMLL